MFFLGGANRWAHGPTMSSSAVVVKLKQKSRFLSHHGQPMFNSMARGNRAPWIDFPKKGENKEPWQCPPRPMASYESTVKGFFPSLIGNPLLLPHSIRLPLSSSTSLSKINIVNPYTSSFLQPIHSKFFTKSSNFFLFLHFPHKSFIFLSKSTSTLHLFHSKFSPFHLKSFIFLLKNFPSFFH